MKKLFVLCLLIFATFSLAQADIPKTIHFQGRLTDLSGNPIPDNPSYGLTFELWNAETGGQMVWPTTAYNVAVKNGYYSLELGPFNDATIFNQPLWLAVTSNTDGTPLSPRIKLDSSAYALNVADGAISTAKLVDSSVISRKNQ